MSRPTVLPVDGLTGLLPIDCQPLFAYLALDRRTETLENHPSKAFGASWKWLSSLASLALLIVLPDRLGCIDAVLDGRKLVLAGWKEVERDCAHRCFGQDG